MSQFYNYLFEHFNSCHHNYIFKNKFYYKMGCMGQSSTDLEAHSVGTLPGIKRQNNKNWPTITYFDMYGRGSPIHF